MKCLQFSNIVFEQRLFPSVPADLPLINCTRPTDEACWEQLLHS